MQFPGVIASLPIRTVYPDLGQAQKLENYGVILRTNSVELVLSAISSLTIY